jgi:hypothetical protein
MAVKLIINNDFSQLQTDNQDVHKYLCENLRFRQKGYQFTPLYKSRKWDGYVNFFSAKTGKFLTGILPEVYLVSKRIDGQIEIEDNRNQINFDYQSIDKDFLQRFNQDKKNKIELTDYQVDFVNQCLKHKRGVVCAPTGAGKTFSMMGVPREEGVRNCRLI